MALKESKETKRDNSLRTLGITVLRVSDRDVLTNLDTVLARIWNEL